MDFDSMTVPQLKDIARANNLKNWSKLKKADLIQFLIDNVPGGARGGRPPSGRPRTPSPRPRSRSIGLVHRQGPHIVEEQQDPHRVRRQGLQYTLPSSQRNLTLHPQLDSNQPSITPRVMEPNPTISLPIKVCVSLFLACF